MKLLALLCLPLACACLAAPQHDLVAYTEEWAPYNFTQAGRIQGIATDFLREACELAALRCDIRMVPWARAYALAAKQPDTLVFSTARKPAREAQFIWLGPFLPRTTWLYARSNLSIVPNNFAGLSSFRVGVVRGEAAISDLLAAGLKRGAMVEVNTNAAVLKLLRADMVDVMVDTEVGMAWNLKQSGLPVDAVRRLFQLNERAGHYYYALNARSSPAKAARLQQAIEQLRDNGRLTAILQRY